LRDTELGRRYGKAKVEKFEGLQVGKLKRGRGEKRGKRQMALDLWSGRAWNC
jgi:hypothetical protein